MFKRISHIIVSVLLLIATTGFTTYSHFCGEELLAESMQTNKNDCCDVASTCCHEEAEILQIDTEYLLASFDYNFGQSAVEITNLLGSTFNNPVKGSTSITLLDHSTSSRTSQMVQSYLQVFLL